MACLFGHKWNGCKCSRCGKERDEQHNWNGCKCTICGTTRTEGHRFAVNSKCEEKCEICGKTAGIKHNLDGSVCTKCGYDSAMPRAQDWFREYKGTAETVSIPHGFKIISAEAFRHNDKIKKVVLPSTITEIKRAAFAWCTELREITIPDSVKYIDSEVFYQCNKLGPVWLPAGINLKNDSFDENHELIGPGAPNKEAKRTPFIISMEERISSLELRDLSENAKNEALSILAAFYNQSRQDADFSNRSADNLLIRRVGEYLNNKGSMTAMRSVGEALARLNPQRARALEYAWNGIGSWQA